MSVFSKIIAGEIPSFKIAEDEFFYAFLDIHPMVRGHVLIVPRQEEDEFFQLDPATLSKWLPFAQPLAKAIELAFPCNRCGISVMGLEVPHAHMHLVPINSADDLNFTRKKLAVTQEQLQQDQQLILEALKRTM